MFLRAQQAAPSVVFMDEVDSLCGERGGSGSLVSELLSLMSQPAVQSNIMVIGATNRPHAVDEARNTNISKATIGHISVGYCNMILFCYQSSV